MRLLDLCCGAGAAADGYRRVGFEIVGVDVEPQPNYPYPFIQADAVTIAHWLATCQQTPFTLPFAVFNNPELNEAVTGPIDAVHASPPCQRWTRSNKADEHPDLITPLRELLQASGLPFVIENVMRAPLEDPTRLCGSSFGLRVRRHRAFETSFPLMALPCAHESQPDFVTVAGGGPNPASFKRGPNATGGPDRKPRNLADALDAMGIDRPMTRREVNEAIPPAYTEHIGGALVAHLDAERAAA